ncbi:MAG: translation initiation factor IF-2 N-terminal domain-containing protein, partial [candidate division Zixibacteria bacterium]|nr:translation initiation factor IF-2 N-terminal domain-containing protein [candidate division Zixibacteria bacterium]
MAENSIRIYQLAKDFKISSAALVKILQDLKFTPKSHMSVATPDMVTAVKKKFAQKKQEAKNEMAHQEQAKQSAGPSAKIGAITVTNSGSDVAGLMRKIVKKQRKKERRRRKDRRSVDKTAVAKSFKATMANLTGAKTRRRYKRSGTGDPGDDIGAENLLEVNEFMSVAELAKVMDRKPAELIAKLFELGMMATINQRLDMDTIEMLAAELGFEATQVAEVGEDALEEEHDESL